MCVSKDSILTICHQRRLEKWCGETAIFVRAVFRIVPSILVLVFISACNGFSGQTSHDSFYIDEIFEQQTDMFDPASGLSIRFNRFSPVPDGPEGSLRNFVLNAADAGYAAIEEDLAKVTALQCVGESGEFKLSKTMEFGLNKRVLYISYREDCRIEIIHMRVISNFLL